MRAETHSGTRTQTSGHRTAGVVGRRSALAFGAAGALVACGTNNSGDAGGSGQAASADKQLVIVDSFAVGGLDPLRDGSSLQKWMIGEPLARVTRKGDIGPWLATSWKAVEPTKWEIRLRDGVTFWDGTSMDAAAVVASLEHTIAKNATARAELGAASIEPGDSKTVVIRTNAPNAALPSALASRDIVILQARAAAAAGDEAFANQPVLTGAFKPVEFKKGETATIVRNDAYWAGKPFLGRIQIKLVGDANARVLALQSGDVEMAMNIPNETVDVVRKTRGFHILETLGSAQEFVVLNPRSAPFDDVRVRQAFSLGIDRRPLVQQVLAPTVEAASDVYSPVHPWAMKNLYPTDKTKATRLLDEAGWRPGPDGIRQKDGKQLAVTTLWYSARPDLQPIGIAIQAQLKALGFKLDLKQVENIGTAVKANDWNAAVYYNNTASTGDPQYLLDSFFRTNAPSGFGVSDQALDRLIDQVRTTFEAPERLKLVNRAQQMLAEQVYMVPLVAKKEIFAVAERLKKAQPPHPVSIYVLEHNFGA